MKQPPSWFWYLLTTAIADAIAQVLPQVRRFVSRPSPMMIYRDDSASRREEFREGAMVRKRTGQPPQDSQQDSSLQDLQPRSASPQEPAVTVETSAVAVDDTVEQPSEKPAAKPAEKPAEKPAAEKPVAEKPAEKPAEPSPAETALKAAIAQLQATLETERQTAQQQQMSLQQTITTLQAELQTQQAQVRSLQAEVQQVQPLKAQLEETKTTLLQLSEVNSQLQTQLQAKLQPIAQPAQAAQSRSTLGRSLSATAPLTVQTPEPGLDSASAKVQASQGIVPMAGRDLPRSQNPGSQGLARRPNSRPVMPTTLPPMSAEQKPIEKGKPPEIDTGWMD